MPAVLIWLAAVLGPLTAAPQAALAASAGAPLITAVYDHSCAIDSGKAYCWGENSYGDLGDGSHADSSKPVAVDTSGALAGKTLTQISAGEANFTCALDSAGHAYCWGYNADNELGDGGSAPSSVPVAVDTSGVLAGKTLTQISAGAEDACVLDSTGAAYCWGHAGALGDSTGAASSVPVAVDTSGALAGKILTQISAAFLDTCALDSTGAAYCWGLNELGELGDGRTGGESDVPVPVDTNGALAGKTLTQITAGGGTCALDSTGAAYCWGVNQSGELGDDSTTDSDVPVPVDTNGALAGKTLTQITAGGCAVDAAGAAYCWGMNDSGQLGDGSTGASSSVPVAVDTNGALAGKTLTQITAGGEDVCAVDAAGAAYCWGGNEGGELGDDNTTSLSAVPVLAGPQAPASVEAVPGGATATVSWAAPASLDGGKLTGYTATAFPGGTACATTGATTCTITGLTNGATTYTITVIARTTAGDSGTSASATFTTTPAPTGPINSGYHKTVCIDDSNDSAANDTKIVMAGCNGSPEQNWTIEADGTIQVNGKCMDIYRDEKANKAPVELWTCTGGANQQWQAVGGTLVNPVSGKCLDDPRFDTTDGIQLEIYTCNGGANQQWQLPRHPHGTPAPVGSAKAALSQRESRLWPTRKPPLAGAKPLLLSGAGS
jgi:alpha-tubulin suppressor-like RCC1 family protein